MDGPLQRSWPWLLAGALIYLSFGFTEMMGSDLWWHIAAGREVIQQGSPWLVDDWSFTEQGSAWHNHEWLADLLFYGWVRVFGVASLVIWKWSLIIATFCLFQQLLTRISGNALAALLACTAAVAIAAPFLDMRPQLYSLLGLAVLLELTLFRSPRLKALLPLFLVWVNLHGGFVFGLMVLAIVLFPWRECSLAALRRAAFTWSACALICLVNPDGLRIFCLPLVYALNADSPYRSLGEWRSPFEAGGITSAWYAYSLVIGAALSLTWLLPAVRRRVRFSPELVAIAVLSAAMSATSRRFIILWAMAFALLLAPFAGALLRQKLVQPLMLPALLALTIWGGLRVAPYSLSSGIAFHYLTAEYVFPHGLADFVEANDLQGKTFAFYNWGGYLHWRSDGALKVFIDGRANTLFDDATYLDYVTVLGARPGWIETVEDSGAELFMWPRGRNGVRLTRGLLQTGRWRLLYEDVRGVLLAREGFALPVTLRLPDDSVDTQLTAAYLASKKGDTVATLAAASRAHEQRPWGRATCTWLRRSLQANGQLREAESVMEACRAYFPSKYLR
ncbi:hypothetical protein [Congregibacter litoralis]|uniref:hypothetical protein n=1 Tax=Congregibacter litoralis TaxID=393662 RepID=UPI00006BF496|nr:hypothetical protein [Congregibacter litoralis]